MEVIPNKNRQSMPKASEVKPSGLPPQDLYTQLFLPLIVVLVIKTARTVFGALCLHLRCCVLILVCR